jgi:hypothetical protein
MVYQPTPNASRARDGAYSRGSPNLSRLVEEALALKELRQHPFEEPDILGGKPRR